MKLYLLRDLSLSLLSNIGLKMSSSSCSTIYGHQRVIILGAGIHGSACAYYLSQKGVRSLIIERSKVASAASGKSGGFLARGWGSGPTRQLHEISFDMHVELASTLDVKSFRRVSALQVQGSRKGSNAASWLDRKATSELMDTATAQVTPLELTEKLLGSALNAGSQLLIGTAEKVIIENGKVTGVDVTNHGVIMTDKVLICLGPWSGVMCEDWFGFSVPLTGIKSTSFVYRDLAQLKEEPYACFCAEDSNGCHLEMYSRIGEELYVCGCGGSDYVSGDRLRPGGDCESSEQIEADPARVAAAMKSLQAMTSITDRPPDVAQACMRPCTDDALPVMGAVPGVEGAYASFGHNCWGILWAPASGLAMAELVIEGESRCIDLRPFDPRRYAATPSSHTFERGRKQGSVPVGEQW